MKKNELRIGNYVLDGVFDSRFEIQIEQIEDLFDSQYYEPIPLTEEWLLKFGFESDDVWIHYVINLEHKRMLGVDLANNHVFLAQHSDVNGFRDVFLTKCKSVNQLQNLYFALTNEELTIKQ